MKFHELSEEAQDFAVRAYIAGNEEYEGELDFHENLRILSDLEEDQQNDYTEDGQFVDDLVLAFHRKLLTEEQSIRLRYELTYMGREDELLSPELRRHADDYARPRINIHDRCHYCGGDCPHYPEDSPFGCDGFLGDLDGVYGN